MKHKLFQKSAAFILVFGLGVSILTGCGGKKEIAFTTGLSKNELFKIDGTVCSMDEANIILLNLQREYAGLFGIESWDKEFAGATVGSYVKSQAVKQLSQIRTLSALASKEGITLNNNEIDAVKNARDDYYNSIDESAINDLDIKKEALENIYKQYCLANKFYQKMIDTVNPEISDDEARIITVQYIFFNTKKTDENGNTVPISEQERNDLNSRLLSVMEQINAGGDFEKIANENSDDENIVMSLARGEAEENFEKAAFNLGDGQVSEAVENDNGVYVIKCISNYDEAATLENKKKIYEKRCNEALNSSYNSYISTVLSEFNDSAWEKVELNTKDSILQLPDLFSIYDNYLPKPSVELQ